MKINTPLALSFLLLLSSTGLAQQTTYSYDSAGRLTTVNYGNGTGITYAYDAGGNVLSITNGLDSSFSISDLGGVSQTSSGSGTTVQTGYGRVRPDAGNSTPAGLAIFGLTANGVLVTEAGVPAVTLVQEGRIFAEVNGPINTGLAIANPNDMDATISFFFTDATGTNFGSGTLVLGANQQTAKFLNQDPFNGGDSVLGTFTFTSSVPVAAIALRGFTNERAEFLITTLPVLPLTAPTADTIYFPHFADGDGWKTEVILVNPTDATVSGTVEFFGPGSGTTPAPAVSLTLDDGSSGSSFAYSVPARSSKRFTTSNPTGLSVGSARASAAEGSATPAGSVVFSLISNGVTVSGAGVPALPEGTAFRVYVEASGTVGEVGSIQSGIALTDASGTTNTVTLELTDLSGNPVGSPQTLTLPPSGQTARFVNEFFTLGSDFSGILRVTSTSNVAIVGLRARTNERSDFMITTTPPSNEAAATTTADKFFPHIVDAGGWSTQFALFSPTAGQTSSGTLSFVDQAGQTLGLSLSGN